MQAGDTLSWTRSFSEEDVRLFGQLSGDLGMHHVSQDAQGRLMVQGLLTATLPSKLGGDINFIAREMVFRFHHPVYANDTIHCTVTLAEVVDDGQVLRLSCSWTCTNQEGEAIMTGGSTGIVRKSATAARLASNGSDA